jgi:hypothetical protein
LKISSLSRPVAQMSLPPSSPTRPPVIVDAILVKAPNAIPFPCGTPRGCMISSMVSIQKKHSGNCPKGILWTGPCCLPMLYSHQIFKEQLGGPHGWQCAQFSTCKLSTKQATTGTAFQNQDHQSPRLSVTIELLESQAVCLPLFDLFCGGTHPSLNLTSWSPMRAHSGLSPNNKMYSFHF